jgi:hypothetical protein
MNSSWKVRTRSGSGPSRPSEVRPGPDPPPLPAGPAISAAATAARAAAEMAGPIPRQSAAARTLTQKAAQPIATMRSIGSFAFAAISGSTLTSNFDSARESRSLGRVIIFMYLQKAIRLASIRLAWGAACWSG